MAALLIGSGQQLTFCRGVVAVTGDAVEQASSRGLAAVPGSWVQQREKRDGAQHHLTLLSKVDLQQLSQRMADGASWCQEVPPDADMTGIAKAAAALLGKMSCTWDWVDVGTGSCKDATGEASFRVVLWPAAAAWRERLELPPKDFHITLGFHDADVHSKSKGVASLRSPEVASLPQLLQLAQRLIPDLESFGPSIEQMLETVQQGEMDVEMQVQALRLWCTYHGRQKQPQQVLLHADQLLELSGNDAVAMRSRGLALVMLQRYQEEIITRTGERANLTLYDFATSFCCKLWMLFDHPNCRFTQVHVVSITNQYPPSRTRCSSRFLAGVAGYALAANVAADDPKSPAKGNYPKTPHLPFSPGVNPDDTRISDCKHLLEAEVVVTEKLDGGNCCLKDGQVFGRTHAQPASHESFSAVKELAANLGPQLEGVQLFGENMQAVHSIEYGNLQSFFYVFAARRGNSWLSWDETTRLAEDLGLPMVSQGDVDEFGGMEERKQAWAWDGWLGSEVQKFPVAVVVDRVLFVHAGLLPEMLDHRTLEELNVAFHGALKHASTSKHMKKDEPKLLGGHGPVWARDYAYGRSNICQLAQQVLQKVDADRMVVGHTIQRDFQVHSKCHGQIILGDTAISSAYGGAMSFIEYDGSEVKARYPGSEAIVALPEVGLPDVTSGDVQRGSGMAWPVLVIIGLLVVAIWRCFSCRKPRTT